MLTNLIAIVVIVAGFIGLMRFCRRIRRRRNGGTRMPTYTYVQHRRWQRL